MSVKLVTSDTEFRSTIADNEAVLVDFYADWCGPCKLLAPKLPVLQEQFPKIKIIKLNCDELSDIQEEYQVTSLPTLKIFIRGEVTKTIVGANIDKIRAALEEVYQVENWTLSTDAPPTAASTNEASSSTEAPTTVAAPAATKAVTGGNVVEITSEADYGIVIQRPCVIDFFAQWCMPCKQLAPFFKDLAGKYPNVNFYKIDYDEFNEIADSVEVASLPSIVFYKDGKKVHLHVGVSKDKINAAFETHFGAPQ